MSRYKCKVCGYIYDTESGEPRNKTAPGTEFEDLPDDWFCPHCGANKHRFVTM
ncbi:rubredoxin [Methanobacterium subterraneum]|uniref:Rubredoxin n=1 Tax=Methanobacterium subterraneum TaxID=59277 RepID=A0A2H4VDN0_9EURY|nr:rubredoxin [Methanobacterium subterraneum]AUB56205.1 rubredoxin [Methanobacterium subterraneum]PKL72487.1 MAG: rubredoxin [Methanobacteriales archaeon HGW-Methanobacteriales-2]